MDPQVWVEIHGVPIDNSKKKTHHVDNNGTLGLMVGQVWLLEMNNSDDE